MGHGTSPRLWGDSPCNARYRFSGINAVHPHACGEILPMIGWNDTSQFLIGTSPRLWGDLGEAAEAFC